MNKNENRDLLMNFAKGGKKRYFIWYTVINGEIEIFSGCSCYGEEPGFIYPISEKMRRPDEEVIAAFEKRAQRGLK
ncbi:hypothetical protein D0T87_09535 [Bacteroides sp. 51]|nr:hypothetical protein [Bacteroides sp. 51]